MNPADNPEAWRLLQNAREVASTVSAREQAYVDALTARYGEEVLDDRTSRDQAFAKAMANVVQQYPNDLDAQVIYAEALMDTTPWDYWQADGQPKPVTEKILASMQSVLQENPMHPMANYLFIHAVEAEYPQSGLEEAERLKDLVPASGHLVHMPAHIYIRTGRYHQATQANLRAIEADKQYFKQVDLQGNYQLGYVPHNYHFGWATATLEGRSELALDLAHDMAASVDTSLMRERGLTTLQHFWITPLFALVRFGHWNDILAWPEPAEDLIYPRATRHYARGMAFTRKGKFEAAEQELRQLQRLRDHPSLQWVTVWDINKSKHILEVADYVLTGELAAARQDFEKAIPALQLAVQREDALNYDEPPSWHYPPRQSLGAVLLLAGQPQQAAVVYREDLHHFPNNGWSLFGLLDALRRQGKVEQAATVQRRFEDAWRNADITLVASRF